MRGEDGEVSEIWWWQVDDGRRQREEYIEEIIKYWDYVRLEIMNTEVLSFLFSAGEATVRRSIDG